MGRKKKKISPEQARKDLIRVVEAEPVSDAEAIACVNPTDGRQPDGKFAKGNNWSKLARANDKRKKDLYELVNKIEDERQINLMYELLNNLVEWALDKDTDPGFRKKCTMYLLDQIEGKPVQKRQVEEKKVNINIDLPADIDNED